MFGNSTHLVSTFSGTFSSLKPGVEVRLVVLACAASADGFSALGLPMFATG